MKKYIRKMPGAVIAFLAIIILFLNSELRADAASNYNTYLYDEWDESVDAPSGYAPVYAKSGLQIGTGLWNVPQDFFMSNDGFLYLADSGNNRIIILTSELELVDIIETVSFGEEEIELTDIEGLYVTEDKTIYACQTSLGRVLVIKDGKVISTIEKPQSTLIQDDFIFAPTKIGIDIYGRAYVLSKGCYTGFLQFDTDGSFMSFYGANKVEVTGEVVFNYMWKNILSDEQRAAMTSIIPIEYSNIDCNLDGFIYTSTVGTQIPKSQIKKLNPLGNNIYYAVGKDEFNFGDQELSYSKGKAKQPAFTDVKVDANGFIFAVDLTTSRVFQRDQEGNLVSVFGGYGNQLGTFKAPVAIENYNGKVYVLDRLKGNITVFEKTEYGALVEEALLLYNAGEYEKATIAWKQVLIRNSNASLAYAGIGKALSQAGEYEDSLNYLKYSGDRYSYSKAFGKNRLHIVKTYGVYVLGSIVVIIIVTTIYRKLMMRRKRNEKRR